MAKHPNINFASKKELHFFDIPSNFERGFKAYSSYFPPLYLDKGSNTAHKKTFCSEHLISPGVTGWFSNVNKAYSGTTNNSSQLRSTRAAPKNVPLNAESTPFYIASDVACEYIAKVIPNVRIILLLREPVSRAYSEYNMKKRYSTKLLDFHEAT